MAGWMFVLAYVGFIMWQVRRAFLITEGSFEDGLWWQRIEQISFLSLPQSLMVLVPAAACAALGTVLVRSLVDHSVVNLSQLTRVDGETGGEADLAELGTNLMFPYSICNNQGCVVTDQMSAGQVAVKQRYISAL